jgi:uncharacterized protein YbjT (DUF2867 family)
MLFVSGATGKTGGEVVRRLLAAGQPVRTLARSAEKAAPLVAAGVEVIIGDGSDAPTLARAVAGVGKVVVAYPNGPQQAVLEQLLVEAAASARVRHIVKLSSMEALAHMTNPVHRTHFESEQRIRATGIPWTMVRPNFYMQNFLASAPGIRTQGKFFLPMGAGKAAMTDTRDVGAVIAQVLTHPGHENQVYEVTGPEVLSFAQVAERFSEVLGRRIEYVDQDPVSYKQHLSQFLKSSWHLDAVCDIFREIREGYSTPATDTFQRLMGRPPTSLAQFIRDHRSAFAAS